VRNAAEKAKLAIILWSVVMSGALSQPKVTVNDFKRSLPHWREPLIS